MENKIWGYRRENGRVGIRNHVVIMPVDDISNAAAEAVAKIVPWYFSDPACIRAITIWAGFRLVF
ncbi:UxaA family hydrolase [Aeribacillus sp. FSL K6-3256]|uniref:UxaA family hydrolase n=1 Tax=Aeribacillus TaxID=1055323 RepID=UPI0030D00D11